ncbi:MAG TPA: PAS domain-containing sensor histidine kinase, partial [Labilithrix sp.]|nr:PAS domain-containing sensor histidine kinase [Labilithrix sp.]
MPLFTEPSTHERLLGCVPRLIAQANIVDILVEACRTARELTGVCHVLGAYGPPPHPWERGTHIAVATDVKPLSKRAVSALFAVHRRVALTRAPTSLERTQEAATIFDGLATSEPAARFAFALPLVHRGGRVVGEIVVLSEGGEAWTAHGAALGHLTAIASAALENAHRLATARREHDRLLLVAETTEDALWDLNLETGELWWGGGIQSLLGDGAERVETRIEWKLDRTHPDDVARVRETFARCAGSMSMSSWRETYRFRRTDGSWAMVEDRAHFMRETNGRVYRVIGALRDVTALHASNEALRENEQRLRAALAASDIANRAKDEFLAMLGHELRNPLSPMSVAVQVMRLRGVESRELDVLDRQVTHVTRLVDDLLDVSRIRRGKIELRKEHVDLADVVARAVEMVSPLLEQRRHALSVAAPRGILVNVDVARIAQVLSNLLTNAAKYSDPGTKVELYVERLAGSARVRVVDQGVGIEPEMVERIFSLFVQRPQTLERAQGGLGLGLAIVKSLVEMHGGSVRASSEGPGKGSEFAFELPTSVAATHRALRSADSKPTNGSRRERILVVDDNA